MIVCRISGCIDHRHFWVRHSECFRDLPSCQRVGQSDIGNEEIDFPGFMKRLQRPGARSRLQHRPSLLPEVRHYVLADYPIILDYENGGGFAGGLQREHSNVAPSRQ